VRLKEKGIAKEVIALSIWNIACQETLRTALAMGADKAILVQTDTEIQPLAAAKILKMMAKKENPELIILGKLAIDSDNNQVGQVLASMLCWPQGIFASHLSIKNNSMTITREIDGGLETLDLQLPAVVTTDLRLNEPRYLSLPNIVQAKRKPLEIISADELQLDLQPRIHTLKVEAPEKRSIGIKVASIKELVHKLKHEAQVIS
jgi:electron transfer flavoprotein beta subunit